MLVHDSSYCYKDPCIYSIPQVDYWWDLTYNCHKIYNRPHLEFAVPVWNPYMKKDIEKLENIQHRATRLVPNLRKKGYELRLTTLEIRRKRGDLIQFYKVQLGHDHIKWMNEPEINLVSRNLRRGGGTCFRREPPNICTSKNEFFLNRVIPIWKDCHKKLEKQNQWTVSKLGWMEWNYLKHNFDIKIRILLLLQKVWIKY